MFLKPERLLLRTMHTMTSVDLAFLKDICVNLLLDPLALKFKQSCTNSIPQNDQIKGPNSPILDSEILDPESQDFQNSSLRIHRSQKGERP